MSKPLQPQVPASGTGQRAKADQPTEHRRRRWSDLGPMQQRAIIAAGIVQVGLATAAWIDLARRPAAAVRGPKPAWAAAIAVNFVGPIAYFAWGRLSPKMPAAAPPAGAST